MSWCQGWVRSTASYDLWVKVSGGQRSNPCKHNGAKSIQPIHAKLYRMMVCHNVKVEFDWQPPMTFESRSAGVKGQILVNTMEPKVSNRFTPNFAGWWYVRMSRLSLIDSLLWPLSQGRRGSKVKSLWTSWRIYHECYSLQTLWDDCGWQYLAQVDLTVSCDLCVKVGGVKGQILVNAIVHILW